ncbi:MAG: MFS transporter [Patescibacteria group bacterium]|nr:MFS transporter [Patescibacteria group bacterium]
MKKLLSLIRKSKEVKLVPLFLTESFRSVSTALLSFFSAIYVFKAQLEITGDQKQAMIAAFLFFLILYIFKLIGTSLAENLSQKTGLRGQILIGEILTSLTILGFIASLKIFAIIWLTSAVWGLAIGFFWFGRHGLIAKLSSSGSYGETLGWASVVNTFLLLGVPFLGGFLINKFGYNAMFIVSFGFMILAFFSLTKVEEKMIHRDATIGQIFKLFSTHKRMALAYFSSGFVGAVYISALILFIFLTVKNEFAFGGFFSLSMLLVAITNMLVGKWVDKKGKKTLIAYGSVFAGIVWLGRFLVGSVFAIFIFDVIDRIASGMTGIPLGVLSYQKAIDGHSTGKAMLFREFSITIGGILGSLLVIFIAFFDIPLEFSFLGASLIALLPLVIIKRDGICGDIPPVLGQES